MEELRFSFRNFSIVTVWFILILLMIALLTSFSIDELRARLTFAAALGLIPLLLYVATIYFMRR